MSSETKRKGKATGISICFFFYKNRNSSLFKLFEELSVSQIFNVAGQLSHMGVLPL